MHNYITEAKLSMDCRRTRKVHGQLDFPISDVEIESAVTHTSENPGKEFDPTKTSCDSAFSSSLKLFFG